MNYEFITSSDTTRSSTLEVEAISYDDKKTGSVHVIPANSFVVIEDNTQSRSWFGQVVEPQRNISRTLSTDNPNSVSALERVLEGTAKDTVFLLQYQYYRIRLIGEIVGNRLESVRVRPRYGSKGRRATAEQIVMFIRFAELKHDDETDFNNAIGVIKDTDIPICIDSKRVFYHVLLAGATGSGKSNGIANFIKASVSLGMACIVIDFKPDYQDLKEINDEAHLFDGLSEDLFYPKAMSDVNYFCLYSEEDDNKRTEEIPIAIRASDASHDMLSAALFYRSGEELQREAFFGMLGHFREHLKEKNRPSNQWTLNEFEQWVNSHRKPKTSKDKTTDWSGLAQYFSGETPNDKVIKAMLSRLATRKPTWMDVNSSRQPYRVQNTGIFVDADEADGIERVQYFDPKKYLKPGSVLVIRRPQSSAGREYGLFLSYLLRRVYNLRRLNQIDCCVAMVVDEAQDIFSGDSLLRSASERTINETLRKGRSKGMGFLVAVQSASQVPGSVLQNLNTRIIYRQNSEDELKSAIPGVSKDMLAQVVNFGPGEALAKVFGVSAPVHAQMAPSPFKLTKEEFE